jgi:hypothetical protein
MRVSFVGYTIDCTVEGVVELRSERLSDQLNDDASVLLLDATVTSHIDGRQVLAASFELERDALYAIQAPDPRGQIQRRVHTVRHRSGATVGPYTLLGLLHQRPGVTLMGGLRLTRPFVAFTDATLAYVQAGQVEMNDCETLLVNGAHVDWVGDEWTAAARIAEDRAAAELTRTS